MYFVLLYHWLEVIAPTARPLEIKLYEEAAGAAAAAMITSAAFSLTI
jgi:hypothetical protein